MAASAIDNVASYLFTQGKKKRKEEAFLKLEPLVVANKETLRSFLTSIFSLILFEGSINLWSFSRPLLSLILIDESAFSDYVQNLIVLQPAHCQEDVQSGFSRLMEGVRPSLDTNNRERFSQNAVFFSSAIKKVVVRPAGI